MHSVYRHGDLLLLRAHSIPLPLDNLNELFPLNESGIESDRRLSGGEVDRNALDTMDPKERALDRARA